MRSNSSGKEKGRHWLKQARRGCGDLRCCSPCKETLGKRHEEPPIAKKSCGVQEYQGRSCVFVRVCLLVKHPTLYEVSSVAHRVLFPRWVSTTPRGLGLYFSPPMMNNIMYPVRTYSLERDTDMETQR